MSRLEFWIQYPPSHPCHVTSGFSFLTSERTTRIPLPHTFPLEFMPCPGLQFSPLFNLSSGLLTTSMYLFPEHVFIEHLLCTRNCPRHCVRRGHAQSRHAQYEFPVVAVTLPQASCLRTGHICYLIVIEVTSPNCVPLS